MALPTPYFQDEHGTIYHVPHVVKSVHGRRVETAKAEGAFRAEPRPKARRGSSIAEAWPQAWVSAVGRAYRETQAIRRAAPCLVGRSGK